MPLLKFNEKSKKRNKVIQKSRILTFNTILVAMSLISIKNLFEKPEKKRRELGKLIIWVLYTEEKTNLYYSSFLR